MGEDKFEVISVGIIKDGYLDKHLETPVDKVSFINSRNSSDDDKPDNITVLSNRKLLNKS